MSEFKPEVGDIITVDKAFPHQLVNSKFRAGDEYYVSAVVESFGPDTGAVYASVVRLAPSDPRENRVKPNDIIMFRPSMPVYRYLRVVAESVRPKTATEKLEAARNKIATKCKLADQCNYYYPILCTTKNGTQQVAAAQTPEGAVTIKATFKSRYPENDYSIGPRSIVMSDELIMLEFEPTPAERIAIHEKNMSMLDACYGRHRPTPEQVKKMLEGIPK